MDAVMFEKSPCSQFSTYPSERPLVLFVTENSITQWCRNCSSCARVVGNLISRTSPVWLCAQQHIVYVYGGGIKINNQRRSVAAAVFENSAETDGKSDRPHRLRLSRPAHYHRGSWKSQETPKKERKNTTYIFERTFTAPEHEEQGTAGETRWIRARFRFQHSNKLLLGHACCSR